MGCVSSAPASERRPAAEEYTGPDDWTQLHPGARGVYDSADWEPGPVLRELCFARVDVTTKRSAPFAGSSYCRETYGLKRHVEGEGEVYPEANPSDLAREIAILKNVGSAECHVIQIFGVLEESFLDQPFKVHLMLERCDEDFLQFVAGGDDTYLPEREAARYAKQLLTAVAHCHSRNIMHRMIKIENLLLRSGASASRKGLMEIVLADFGHATAFVKGKPLKRPKSSPIYASPEEIANGEYTEKIDVWACGIVLMALVGGLGDVEAKTYRALHGKGVAGALALRAHPRSPMLVVLLEGLLARDASERVSAADALRTHAAWLSGGGVAADRALERSPSLSDFGRRAKTQLARINLQRVVNRGLRRAPLEEQELLACAVRDDNRTRLEQKSPAPAMRRTSTLFHAAVTHVINEKRDETGHNHGDGDGAGHAHDAGCDVTGCDAVDDVLARDDIVTVAQLRHAVRHCREQGEMFSDVEAALDECCNEDMIIHLEISPLVVEADRKELFESPKSARTGSRHVRFAYEIVMKSL